MPARTFNRDSQAGGRSDPGHDPEGNFLPLEQRALLDVHFHKCFVVTARQLYFVEFSLEPRLLADLFERCAVFVGQNSRSVGRQTSGKQPTAKAADAKPCWLLRGKNEQFDGVFRAKSAATQ